MNYPTNPQPQGWNQKYEPYHTMYAANHLDIGELDATKDDYEEVILSTRRRLLKSLATYLVPVAITATLLWINTVQIFWFAEEIIDGISMVKGHNISTTVALNLLQFAAKLHEMVMITSLATITRNVYKRRLIGIGIPFGLLLGGYRVGEVGYFMKKSFWDGFWLEAIPKGTKRIVFFLILTTVLPMVLGPASAILMIPTQVFGFAQSDNLTSEGSANAGLKDQRLAIEWVQNNIAQFGGDPERITIFGQSSGGLSVSIQIMAYGGSKPVPFKQAISQSSSLEPGITSNLTKDAMESLTNFIGCNQTSLDSEETVTCLRGLDMGTLLNASIATYQGDVTHNLGDLWLPIVDGDFLPAAPSQLIQQGRFAKVTTMIGWCEDDPTLFMDNTISTAQQAHDYIQSYIPDMNSSYLESFLGLYPSNEFTDNPTAKLSGEFYRTARIFRDILMACEAMWFTQHLSAAGAPTYLYEWNQTVLGPYIQLFANKTGLGVTRGPDLAYIYDVLLYNQTGVPLTPSPSDYMSAGRASRSWAAFATTGQPGMVGRDTFQGFGTAFPNGAADANNPYIFVAGEPNEGSSSISGADANPAVAAQKLSERCAFINSADFIANLHF